MYGTGQNDMNFRSRESGPTKRINNYDGFLDVDDGLETRTNKFASKSIDGTWMLFAILETVGTPQVSNKDGFAFMAYELKKDQFSALQDLKNGWTKKAPIRDVPSGALFNRDWLTYIPIPFFSVRDSARRFHRHPFSTTIETAGSRICAAAAAMPFVIQTKYMVYLVPQIFWSFPTNCKGDTQSLFPRSFSDCVPQKLPAEGQLEKKLRSNCVLFRIGSGTYHHFSGRRYLKKRDSNAFNV
ncbi:hypothetical protein C8R45DRAFT_947881 [Mycena sanguinolenta]|nr:hypothetical protein C8R45DRAFT_947881 [Mycena sanguinolenta]